VKLMFKDYGRVWADETAVQMRQRVPVKTGRLKGSIRRKSATQRKATVVGHYSANFVDAGSKEHDILPKRKPALIFEAGGRTIFARKVHKQRIAARRFKAPSARAALQKHPMKETLTELWNKAA
jgi:hypothetical protein